MAFAAATSQRPALEGGTKAMPKLTSSYDEFKKILHNIVGSQPHLGKPRPIQWAIVYILEVLDTSWNFA